MTRRTRKPRRTRDHDLALALAHLQAAFGPVQILTIHPNPHPTSTQHHTARRDGHDTAQATLDLDTLATGAGS